MNYAQVNDLKSKIVERQQSEMHKEGENEKRERCRCEFLTAGMRSPLSTNPVSYFSDSHTQVHMQASNSPQLNWLQ